MATRPHIGLNAPLVTGAVNSIAEIRHASPSLDPRVIEAIEGYGDATKGYVSNAHTCFSNAHSTITKLIAARDSIRKDPTLNESGQLLRLAGVAEKAQDTVLKSFDYATKQLEAAIAHTEGELNKPLAAEATYAMSSEIRTFFRQLEPEERRARLDEAIKNGDAKTASAVLSSGAPYLAGINDTDQRVYLRQWNELRHPEVSTRLSVMKNALELVYARGPLVIRQVEDVLGGEGAWQRVNHARGLHHAAEVAAKLE